MTKTEMIDDEIQNPNGLPEASDRNDDPLPSEDACETSQEAEETAPMDQSPSEHTEEITRLQKEVVALREALAKKEEEEAILSELAEFRRLFPKASVGELPSEVEAGVNRGIPLTAAYALYEKKREAEELRARQINKENAVRSAGKAGTGTAGEYFSPEEVRAMSQKEVREHYAKIRESMKSWR